MHLGGEKLPACIMQSRPQRYVSLSINAFILIVVVVVVVVVAVVLVVLVLLLLFILPSPPSPPNQYNPGNRLCDNTK